MIFPKLFKLLFGFVTYFSYFNIKGKLHMTRKLDKEHVDAIRELQQQFAQNASQLGNATIEIKMLETQLQHVKTQQDAYFSEFETLRKTETDLIETLKARYGDGEINIEAGTFTPAG